MTKTIFVGNSGSGKTFTRLRLEGRQLPLESQKTLGVEVTTYRTIPSGNSYAIWDCAGDPMYQGLGDAYYINATLVFVFVGGVGNKTPQQWAIEVRRVVPNVQIHLIDGDTLEEKYQKVRTLLV